MDFRFNNLNLRDFIPVLFSTHWNILPEAWFDFTRVFNQDTSWVSLAL